MNSITSLKQDLQALATEERAKASARYFKTGPGQYGEGDIFIGVTVPDTRKIAKKYKNINLEQIQELLKSKIHEHRLTALLILVEQFNNSNEKEKQEIYNFYLNHTKHINNWDLVDLSAHQIVGSHILNKEKSILEKLAKSQNLWEKRIAIISTFEFIRKKEFKESFKIANILMQDKHDLIHKAVGWMLREIGKKDQAQEKEFLNKHYKTMPRTMLRYAIKRFSKEDKMFYMKK